MPRLSVLLTRHAAGMACLATGFGLLGACGLLAARGLKQDPALYLLKTAYIRPEANLPMYGAGVLLSLAGVWLSRAWALPFRLFSALCFASLGAAAVSRWDGREALDALSLFSAPATSGEALMLLWVGGAAWMAGLYADTWGRRPVPAVRPAPSAPRTESPAPPADGTAGARVPVLKLTGTEGLVKGLVFVVGQGTRVGIGRSPSCGLSLHALRTAVPRDSTEGQTFRSISRRHATIRFKESGVRITARNRSATFVDGDKIDTVILSDLGARTHTLRLGGADTFRLELSEA